MPSAPIVHHEGFAGLKPEAIKTFGAMTADLKKYLVVMLPGAFTPT